MPAGSAMMNVNRLRFDMSLSHSAKITNPKGQGVSVMIAIKVALRLCSASAQGGEGVPRPGISGMQVRLLDLLRKDIKIGIVTTRRCFMLTCMAI